MPDPSPRRPADTLLTLDRLRTWLMRRASSQGMAWLESRRDRILAGASDVVFFTAFGAVPRHLGKADLALTPDDLEQAAVARPGWDPSRWSCDQAGRTYLLLSVDDSDPKAFGETLTMVLKAADLGELIALYQALPLLPWPERHRPWAQEGVRSNMVPVFNAIALRNPYPAEVFDEPAWNQLVLKAVFLESPLHEIQGLDHRANRVLAHMLVDFAHERWAAHRLVMPELWRPVGPFAEGPVIDDLARVLGDPDPLQRQAAALALHQSPDPRASAVLDGRADLKQAIAAGRLSWKNWTGKSWVEGFPPP